MATDRSPADVRPAFTSRLQATLPNQSGRRPVASGPPESSIISDSMSAPRLQPPAFAPTRVPVVRDRFTPGSNFDAKPQPGGFQSACEAIYAHRWLIIVLLLIGGGLGVAYSNQLCTPLYRVQASLELQNNKLDSSVEALAHVLESQSLMTAAVNAMPYAERSLLLERPKITFLPPRDANARLRERITAVAIPSAQVIDINLISPSRQAGVDFVNALIRSLMDRTAAQKLNTNAGTSDPVTINPATQNPLAMDPLLSTTRVASDISVIDPAIASTEPVSPNIPINVLVGSGLGVLMAITIALIRKFATNTFAGPGSVGQVLGMRELGAIPERKLLTAPGVDPATADVQIDANDESLRYLRSSLLYHPGKQEVRCIAFTSAAPGEGKTTVVTNLSMSLAATGRRVLVIDGDLRRPRLYKLLQVPQGPGLSDLLRRDPAGPPAILSKYVSPTSFQNLYVLPPGSGGSDAPELLAGPILAKLIRDIGKSFDFVLIDTPPLLACSDARNYARAVEGVVLVVRSSETQKKAALVARDMLLQDGATIIGTVLTGWRQSYPAYNYPATANYARS